MNQYFDEACSLSYIARDISRSVQISEQKNINVNEVKQDVYNRLREWEAKLPEVFNPKDNPAPHILLLRLVLPRTSEFAWSRQILTNLPTECGIMPL